MGAASSSAGENGSGDIDAAVDRRWGETENAAQYASSAKQAFTMVPLMLL